jgi:hypothetical protein
MTYSVNKELNLAHKKNPPLEQGTIFYKAFVISFSLVSIGLDALAFQGLD